MAFTCSLCETELFFYIHFLCVYLHQIILSGLSLILSIGILSSPSWLWVCFKWLFLYFIHFTLSSPFLYASFQPSVSFL